MRLRGGEIRFGMQYLGCEVEQVEDGMLQPLVEVYEKVNAFFVKRAQVVGVVVKKGAALVTALECVPVKVAPVSVVRDADVAHRCFAKGRFFDGHGKRLHAVGACDEATVAVGLLYVMLMRLNHYLLRSIESRVVADGGEVCRGK